MLIWFLILKRVKVSDGWLLCCLSNLDSLYMLFEIMQLSRFVLFFVSLDVEETHFFFENQTENGLSTKTIGYWWKKYICTYLHLVLYAREGTVYTKREKETCSRCTLNIAYGQLALIIHVDVERSSSINHVWRETMMWVFTAAECDSETQDRCKMYFTHPSRQVCRKSFRRRIMIAESPQRTRAILENFYRIRKRRTRE